MIRLREKIKIRYLSRVRPSDMPKVNIIQDHVDMSSAFYQEANAPSRRLNKNVTRT